GGGWATVHAYGWRRRRVGVEEANCAEKVYRLAPSRRDRFSTRRSQDEVRHRPVAYKRQSGERPVEDELLCAVVVGNPDRVNLHQTPTPKPDTTLSSIVI